MHAQAINFFILRNPDTLQNLVDLILIQVHGLTIVLIREKSSLDGAAKGQLLVLINLDGAPLLEHVNAEVALFVFDQLIGQAHWIRSQILDRFFLLCIDVLFYWFTIDWPKMSLTFQISILS